MNEFRISRKITNKSFYLLAFIIGFGLFYALSLLMTSISLVFYANANPNIIDEYLNYASGGVLTDNILMVTNLGQFLGQILLTILVIIFLRKLLVKDLKDFKDNFKTYILMIIVGAIILIFAQQLMAKLLYYFGVEGDSENQEIILKSFVVNNGYLMFISVAFFAPFLEEIIFRKLLFGVGEVSFKMPLVASVLFSAILFALLHSFETTDNGLSISVFFISYFVMALILTLSYPIAKRNIFVPIGIHFINNGLLVLSILLLK